MDKEGDVHERSEKIFPIWIFGLMLFMLPLTVASNPQTYHVPDELISEVNRLIYTAKYDSAQQVTLEYLKNESLTDEERFFGHFLYAETIRSSGRPVEAVSAFNLVINMAHMIPQNKELLSLGYKGLAGAYFAIPDYEKANEFAEKSIAISPDSTISSSGHATVYLITGYYHFNKKNYPEAHRQYLLAKSEYLKVGARCELPLVYTKMAELFNEKNNVSLAMAYIDSSRRVSTSCDIMLYRILTEETCYRIQRKNRNYREAVESSEVIADLHDQMRIHEQQMRMESMEKAFLRRLQESELNNLRRINEKNKTILTKQNQIIWIAVSASAIMGVMMVLLFMAHQRRLRAMKELEQLNARLEENVVSRTAHLAEANKRISEHSEVVSLQNKKLMDFYHIITHNLRAPLANLTGLIALIKQSSDEKEKQDLMGHITASVSSMDNTVNQLLEAMQLSVQKEEDSGPSDFAQAFATAAEGLNSQIEIAGAEITTDFTKAPLVKYPAQLLVSLFHNLLSNSLKYRSPSRKPQVNVRSFEEEGNVVLRFEDNGLGMDLEKYGDRLFRAGRVFHQHPEAKGIGLYMTHMQMVSYGGNIRAESKPDQGTTFIVTF